MKIHLIYWKILPLAMEHQAPFQAKLAFGVGQADFLEQWHFQIVSALADLFREIPIISRNRWNQSGYGMSMIRRPVPPPMNGSQWLTRSFWTIVPFRKPRSS